MQRPPCFIEPLGFKQVSLTFRFSTKPLFKAFADSLEVRPSKVIIDTELLYFPRMTQLKKENRRQKRKHIWQKKPAT